MNQTIIITLGITIVACLTISQYYLEGFSEFYSNKATSYATSQTNATSDKTMAVDSIDKANTKYNSNNYDIQYHDDVSGIALQTSLSDSNFGSIAVKDACGNIVNMPTTPVQGSINYYQPGTYTYGASTYVPSYEDSVYLSRTTGISFTSPVYNTSSQRGGFCTQYANDQTQLELACNAIPANACASTSCCVLLGGQKCVSGNQSGPKLKTNYSDIFIKNRDFYYYQGKCYGNCQ